MKHLYSSLVFLIVLFTQVSGQVPDTVSKGADSINGLLQPEQVQPLRKLLTDNIYLNADSKPVAVTQKLRQPESDTAVFYLIAGLLFLFGIIKTVFSRYFATLFRVFFNSSLRQSQLTDQLVQAKLPSLFFNLVFVLSAGLYTYLLLQRQSEEPNYVRWLFLLGCLVSFIVIYSTKFFCVKFIGWVTGYNTEADTYIFIVFLINKIIGVCLLPMIVILAFADVFLANAVLVLSLVFIGIMLLFRFVRSFSLLQHKLKISWLHFLLFIFALEILPLILIYKAVELFIAKKL